MLIGVAAFTGDVDNQQDLEVNKVVVTLEGTSKKSSRYDYTLVSKKIFRQSTQGQCRSVHVVKVWKDSI